MRTALIGRTTLRFDAVAGIGPHPRDGAVVETVRSERRRLFIEWDDGIVLETALRFSGEWHLYRTDVRWQKPMSEARAVIEVAGWVAVCFGAVDIETYRAPDNIATHNVAVSDRISAHPGSTPWPSSIG